MIHLSFYLKITRQANHPVRQKHHCHIKCPLPNPPLRINCFASNLKIKDSIEFKEFQSLFFDVFAFFKK